MEIKLFESMDGSQMRTIMINEEVWFVAVDICNILELGNVSKAIYSLDEDEKKVINNNLTNSKGIKVAGNPNMNIVNESGLYSLIFKSRKENAQKFKKWITSEVIPSIRKTGGYNQGNQRFTPAFVQRYYENKDRVEKKYFSVIGEMYIKLYGEFDKVGYIIQDKAFDGKELRPDISVGKLFSSYLKKHHPEHENNFKTYNHVFKSGLMIEARQYPNALLPIFYDFILDEWIPKYAYNYFKIRDPKALEYLPKLIS